MSLSLCWPSLSWLSSVQATLAALFSQQYSAWPGCELQSLCKGTWHFVILALSGGAAWRSLGLFCLCIGGSTERKGRSVLNLGPSSGRFFLQPWPYLGLVLQVGLGRYRPLFATAWHDAGFCVVAWAVATLVLMRWPCRWTEQLVACMRKKNLVRMPDRTEERHG